MSEGVRTGVEDVQSTLVGSDPDLAATVLIDAAHEIAAQATRIFRVVGVANKGLVSRIETIQTTSISANPNNIFRIFNYR